MSGLTARRLQVGIRLLGVIMLVAFAAALGSWALGLWHAQSTPRATVDHCYVTYDRQENRHTRCVGGWTRGNQGHRGPVYGVAVAESWPLVSTGDPNENDEWEVVVPESHRNPRVLADSRQAWVLSPEAFRWGLLPMVGGALVVALAWAVTATFVAMARTGTARPGEQHTPTSPSAERESLTG
jgi:hypothetical protein